MKKGYESMCSQFKRKYGEPGYSTDEIADMLCHLRLIYDAGSIRYYAKKHNLTVEVTGENFRGKTSRNI